MTERGSSGAVLLAWAEPAASDEPVLGLADAARAAALGEPRRAAFVTGRRLVTELVGELFPGSAVLLRNTSCPRCGRPHGGVLVAGAPVLASISHADGLTVAAVASTADVSRLGLDAESGTATAERVRDVAALLGCRPSVALRRWTQVEAVLKADGRGLGLDPSAVSVDGRRAGLAGEPEDYLLADVGGPAGYLISVAWRDAAASAAVDGRASHRATGQPARR